MFNGLCLSYFTIAKSTSKKKVFDTYGFTGLEPMIIMAGNMAADMVLEQ